MNYKKKYVTVFYIDIRNYTKLSKLKEPKIVVDFILSYRNSIDREFEKINNEVTCLHKINIGDAMLIIFETDKKDRQKNLKTVVDFSKDVKNALSILLKKWENKNDDNGYRMNYFEKVNFGIGISQGDILATDTDYIGFPINHAAKIGDMRTLHKVGHIGIDKSIFEELNIGHNVFLDKKLRKKFIGHTRVGEYVFYSIYEKTYGEFL